MQDKKNQYIWLENHQPTNSFDQNIIHTSSTTSICGAWADCGDSWAPGIYSMIQVGKDQKQASPVISDIYVDAYTSTPWHPNVLASWLYPLTATGNHDYTYTTLFPPPNDACLFGNSYILQDRQIPSNTKPNPFTGFSDLFSIDNTNGSLQLGDAGDQSALGYIDHNGTQIVNKLNKGGLETAFRCNGSCPATGKKILSISTNPSSTPVLTYKSMDNHAGGNQNAPESFENRTILLNGLSVSILEENHNPALFGPGAVKMQIQWDDYDVENDVRWCADNIHLSPNDFNSNNYSLVIKNGSKVLIDRGGSPTWAYKTNSPSGDFTQITHFKALTGSKINIDVNGSIEVDNGSILELETGSNIDIKQNAKIIVKRGGRLIMNSGSTINVENGGRIIIEDDGSMDYFPNAIVKLNGSNSVLEINGMLNIKDNATFTFTYPPSATQHGYLLFANTSLTPSRNITAGNNCNINFTGSTQSKKILQIDQETFYAPPSIVNFTISTGKVELASGARLQADGLSTAINFFNTKFTSTTPGINNGHRGVHLYGQPNVSISACVFEYGSTGINAFLTYGGAPLNIYSSTFRNNTNGLLVNDKGCNLYSCSFFDNEFGFIGGYMSFPSLCEGSWFNGNTGIGCYWLNYSNASLTINNTNVQYNATGIKVHAAPLNVRCSNISNNDIGIDVWNGATLTMNNQAKVIATGNNNYTIHSQQANNFILTNGQNDLTPAVLNSQRSIFGTVILSTPIPPETSNKWNTAGTFSSSDYYLYDLINNIPVTLADGSPLNNALACGVVEPCPNPPCNVNSNPCKPLPCIEYEEEALLNCPDCRTINTTDFTNKKLNEAVSKAIDKVNSHESQNYRKALKLFSQILNVDISNPNKHESYLLNLGYLKLQETLGNAFLNKQIISSNTLADEVQKVIDIENNFIDKANQQKNYYRKFLYTMDKAQTYRIANRRDLSLNVLNNILAWVQTDDLDEVNNFLCTINTEIDVLDGRIDPGTIAGIMNQCNQTNKFRLTAQEDNSVISGNSQETMISIFPNPINDMASIRINIENANITLFDGVGRSIKYEKINFDIDIDLSAVARGIYILKIENLKTSEHWIKKLIVQ